MKIFQKGFNYGQDGKGNRLVYHMQGCNLRCPWCANPEGMRFAPPVKGGVDLTSEQIAKEAADCKALFFDGGVTFTGGEPTAQFFELKECLQLLKRNGINTAIETNGTCARLSDLFPYIDHLIMDVKHTNREKLKNVTGADLNTVRNNLSAAVEFYPLITVRIPLIHAFNDDDFEGVKDLFFAVGREKLNVEILPYHEFGKKKWSQCGYPYTVKDGYVDAATIEEFKKL